MSEQTTVSQEPTPEEIKAMRENLSKYYKEQLSLLKQQVEFEEIQARIAEAKLKTHSCYIRLAQLKMGPKDEKDEEEDDKDIRDNAEGQTVATGAKRVLKKD